MTGKTPNPLAQKIEALPDKLTPKGRIISEYLIRNSRKAVFMTARELASACDISEATVIRFVAQLGYRGYSEMQQALRDYLDTELTLLDRQALLGRREHGLEGFRKTVAEEIDNLSLLYQRIEPENLEKAVRMLFEKKTIYVVGSRLSYTMAHYMGWSLTKVKKNIHILKGSDSTTFDWLTFAPDDCLVVVVATSRYPNELVRLGRWVRRRKMTLMVITDGATCPVIPLADLSLVAPSQHIPFLGSPTSISCLINYLVHEVASQIGTPVKEHQEEIERTYFENDLMFNPTH